MALSVQENVLPAISGASDNPYLKELVAQGKLGNKSKQGFYDWNERDMDELLKKRNDFIMTAIKELRR